MEKKKPEIKIPIKKNLMIRADDYKTYYVTGAMGGFRNPYDFRLSFFRDDITELMRKKNNIMQEDLSDDEKEKKMRELVIPLDFQCELIMTERAMKELYDFLGKESQKIKELREKNLIE